MYNVSQDYINATKELTTADYMTGTIKLASGAMFSIDDTDIALDSVAINSQCLESEELSFGGAVASKLDISIFSDADRYTFLGAEISLTYYLRISEDPELYESLPLGVFYVKEAERNFDKLKMTCYDGLSKLDKSIGSQVFSGNPYVILSGLCTSLGVTFGMTEQEVQALPNGSDIIQLDKTTDCKSYRDVARYVAQMLGCFVRMDRTGNLVLRRFNKYNEVVDTLAEGNRYTFTPQDFSCNYSKISITGNKGTFEAEDIDVTGLTMYIQNAPAWNYGLNQSLQTRTNRLLAYLLDIDYTPGKLSIPGNPAYDCGDLIELSYADADSVYMLVTEINWRYRGNTDLESVGTNPYFNDSEGVSHTSSSSGVSSSEKLTIISYTNLDEIEIPAEDFDWHKLFRLVFITNSETSVVFVANIDCNVTPPDKTIDINIPVKDGQGNSTTITLTNGQTLSAIMGTATTDGTGELEFRYIYDGREQIFHPKDIVGLGNNLISLVYPIASASERSVHTFDLYLKSDGSAVMIPMSNIQAAIFGQNLADNELWDGIITLEDVVNIIEVIIDTYNLTDLCTITQYVPIIKQFSDNINPMPIARPSLQNITDNVIIKLRYIDSAMYMSQQFPCYMGGWKLI